MATKTKKSSTSKKGKSRTASGSKGVVHSRKSSAAKSQTATLSQRRTGTSAAKNEKPKYRRLRDDFGVTQSQMQRLTGLSIRTLSALETGNKKATLDDQRRFKELSRLHEGLTLIMQPDAIQDWLMTPNEYFDGHSPVAVIEHGEIDRIWRMILRLQDGVPL